jgi:HEAT repeat protein
MKIAGSIMHLPQPWEKNMVDVRQLGHHIQSLDKGNDVSRRQALHSLKDHDETAWATVSLEAINSLVGSLQRQLLNGTTQPAIRQETVTILGKIGPRSKSAIPQLVELLEEGVPDAIRESTTRTLGKIGKEAKSAIDPLIKLLTHRRPSLVVHALRALGDVGCADQRVRAALTDLWRSPVLSQAVQVEAAITLCKLKIEIGGLLRFLTATLMAGQDVAHRKSAAEALSFCGKNGLDVVPALLAAALTDKNTDVRQKAQVSLDRLNLPQDKAIQLCAQQLKDAIYAETALRKSGLPAVAALIKAVASDDVAIREKAVRVLGGFGEPAAEAAPALTRALRDKHMSIRLEAAKALWNTTKKPEMAVPVLVELLEEKWSTAQEFTEPRRRFLQTVIEALWRIGPPAKAALPALIAKSKDKNRLVSEAALSAIKEINLRSQESGVKGPA